MPRKGDKCLYVDEMLHEKVKKAAKEKGVNIRDLVENELTKAVEVETS